MTKTILLPGAFDTKGREYGYLRELITFQGLQVFTLNWGVLGGTDLFPVQIDNREVARAGGSDIERLRQENDQKSAMEIMEKGVTLLTRKLYEEGKIQGVLGLGRVRSTKVISSAMRALPIGVPKVMISTVAAGDISSFVGVKDILMFPSIVDISGLNRISKTIFREAVGAVCGMTQMEPEEPLAQKPVITITLFGQTKPCVDRCREALEKRGYEVLVFHATGTGGRTMEAMVEDGYVQAVLDITPTEVPDALYGGIFSAGAERLEAPGKAGIPHLIVPGCVDMVNFGPINTVPQKYRDRQLVESKASVTLMRTNIEENAEMGELFARKINKAKGKAGFLLPLKGLSRYDRQGEIFWWPEADQAFFTALEKSIEKHIPIEQIDCHINDEPFARRAVEMLLAMIEKKEY
jgi:uncharacterized protein (UPF0261 family)